MATNFVQPGNVLTIPAPADVLGGGVVIAGGIKGIAAGDADSGETVDVHVGGVWSLPRSAPTPSRSGRRFIGMRATASRPRPARATPPSGSRSKRQARRPRLSRCGSPTREIPRRVIFWRVHSGGRVGPVDRLAPILVVQRFMQISHPRMLAVKATLRQTYLE
jgi:predicted RecA/RadA family phage recombinase